VRDKIHVEKLVWGAQESYALPPRFDLIIASDTLYAVVMAAHVSLHH
jgi:hypothetical protein